MKRATSAFKEMSIEELQDRVHEVSRRVDALAAELADRKQQCEDVHQELDKSQRFFAKRLGVPFSRGDPRLMDQLRQARENLEDCRSEQRATLRELSTLHSVHGSGGSKPKKGGVSRHDNPEAGRSTNHARHANGSKNTDVRHSPHAAVAHDKRPSITPTGEKNTPRPTSLATSEAGQYV